MRLAPRAWQDGQRPGASRAHAPAHVSLLDLDPDLGAVLDEPRRRAARAELLVRVLRLARGHSGSAFTASKGTATWTG
jgi:hypothetical protein